MDKNIKMQYLIYRIDVNIHDIVIFINTDRTVELEKKEKL